MRRLGVYYFHDQDGIVDSYIPHMLAEMNKHLDRLLVVCHGILTPESRDALESHCDELITADGSASRKSALYTAIKGGLVGYDELILMDNRAMGPVIPLDAMFAAMDTTDTDVWIILNYDFFIATRSNVFSQRYFDDYWEDSDAHNLLDHLENIGCRRSMYPPADELFVVTDDPLMTEARRTLSEFGCPFFLPNIFYENYEGALMRTAGQAGSELYQYLKSLNMFDTRMLWDYLLRTQNQFDLFENMHLMHVVSSKHSDPDIIAVSELRVALVMHLYYEDLFEQSFAYAQSAPVGVDIFITTNTETKEKAIKKIFGCLSTNRVEVRVIENRGRDVSSILVGMKDVVHNYDVMCFVHDKKTLQIKPAIIGEGFARKCWDNILLNQHLFVNIVSLFKEDPALGLLSPPPPNHASTFFTIASDWGPNYEATRQLADKLGCKASISPDKMPIAPLGTCFWFRTKAMRSLFDADWNYEDFPKEPNATDATFLHAMERYYAYAVQHDGYYPAFVLSDEFSRVEYTNLRHYVRGYNKVVIDHGFVNYYTGMLSMTDQICAQMPALRDQIWQHQQVIDEKQRYIEETLVPLTSLRTMLRSRVKRLLPRLLFGCIIRIKRLIFGPRGVPYRYDD